jgi:hypothetical protein
VKDDRDAVLALPRPLVEHLLGSLEAASLAIHATVAGPRARDDGRRVKVIGMSHGGEAFVYQDAPALLVLARARAELERTAR